jgi:hypothetical protein
LVIGFIHYLQVVTTCNCIAITNSHTLQFTTARTMSSHSTVFNSRCLVTASTADVPLILDSRNIPVPQLPASNSSSSQRVNCSSLTNSLTHKQPFTSLHCTALTLSLIFLFVTPWHGQYRKHRSSVAVQ